MKNTTDYIHNFLLIFHNKALWGIGVLIGFLMSFVETKLQISWGIFAGFILLSLIDLFTGILAGVVKEGKKFKSYIFFKKPFLMGFSILVIYIANELILHIQSIETPISAAEYLQSTVVYVFIILKIALIVQIIIYELTSLRENAERLNWDGFIKLIDILLKPIDKLKDFLFSKLSDSKEDLQKEYENDDI